MPPQRRQILEVPFPIKGLHKGTALRGQPKGTTPHAQNVRSFEPMDKRIRGGRRPGLSKFYATQPSGAANPIQLMTEVVRAIPYGGDARGKIFIGHESEPTYEELSLHDLDLTHTRSVNTASSVTWSVCFDEEGLYAFVAVSSAGGNNAQVLKIDVALGTVIWTFNVRTTAFPRSVVAYDVLNNQVIVGGITSTKWDGAGGVNANLWALNAESGAVVWSYRMGNGAADYIHGVTVDSSGIVYVAGLRTPWWGGVDHGATNASVWRLTQTASAATVSWAYDHPTNSTATAVALNVAETILGIGASASDVYTLSGLTAIAPTLDWTAATLNANVYGVVFLSTGRIAATSNTGGGGVADAECFPIVGGAADWAYDMGSVGAGQNSNVLIDRDTSDNIYLPLSDRNNTNDSGNMATLCKITNAGADVDQFDHLVGCSGANCVTVFRPPVLPVRPTITAFTIVSNGNIYTYRNGVVTLATGGTGMLRTDLNVVQSTSAYGRVYYVDGNDEKRYTLTTETVDDWSAAVLAAHAGDPMPANCRLICRYRGRIVLSGNHAAPHNWYMSRVNDPLDWVYAPPAGVTAIDAVAGNNCDAGEIGDIVTALIPCNDDMLLFGGDHTIYVLTGDPAAGGAIDRLSDQTGIRYGHAWTRDAQGYIYFVGTDGIRSLNPSSGEMKNLTLGRLDGEFDDIDWDQYRAYMTWDNLHNGLWLLICSHDPATYPARMYYWDAYVDAWWSDAFPTSMGPCSMIFFDGPKPEDRAMLMGCLDGYIRETNDAATDDDGTAISATVTFAPLSTKTPGAALLVTQILPVMAENSADVTLRIGRGPTEEAAVASGLGGQAISRILSAGRNATLHQRIRGGAIALQMISTGGPWAMETLGVGVQPAGLQRRRGNY